MTNVKVFLLLTIRLQWIRFTHSLIVVEGGVSCGISGTVETPQERFLRRGGSTPAPRKLMKAEGAAQMRQA